MGRRKEKPENLVAPEPSVVEADTPLMSIEEYLRTVQVNEGLVASFKYEGTYNQPEMLEPKTQEDWGKAFLAQSKRHY